jgi:membrane protease YdiL (CAAX protease family)
MIKEVIKELTGQANIVDLIICAAGVAVLITWLLRTSFGTQSLVKAPVRRNDTPIHLAFIPFFIWIASTWMMTYAKETAFPELSGWQDAFADNLILSLGAAPMIATLVIIVWLHFARRLKGLGLNPKTIGRDLKVAILNLVAILPVIWGMIILTTIGGKLIIGPEFEMPRHEGLKEIITYPQISLRVLIVVTAILILPVAEEMIFRGFLQTLLRSYILRPWRAVILTSLVFIVFHKDPQHWPALFMLSLAMGYAYEKTGSLFRPIFIHSMFNALSVLVALRQ